MRNTLTKLLICDFYNKFINSELKSRDLTIEILRASIDYHKYLLTITPMSENLFKHKFEVCEQELLNAKKELLELKVKIKNENQ